MRIILDTNIIIAYFDGTFGIPSVLTRLIKNDAELFLSVVSLTELLANPKVTKKFQHDVLAALTFVTLLDVNQEVSLAASSLIRQKKMRLGDSLIAATAIVHNGIILTRDRHFKKLGKLAKIL